MKPCHRHDAEETVDMHGDERASFAEQLATLRSRADLSLADVGTAAHVARGYVHHIEHGRRWPTQPVAKALDTALGAEGALLATWEAANILPRAVVEPADPDEFERFSAALANPRRTDAAVVEHLARLLAEQRRAEDTLGARQLLGPVLAQIHVINDLIRQARNPVRTAVLEVAAHYEEFAGWMYQDCTDTAGALRHYDAAMEAAQEIGDADMVTSVLSLKSHLAWAGNDAAQAIGLAAAGQREPQRVEDAPPWVYFHGPERLAFQRGVAYAELGRHADAVALLSTALAGLPDCYERDRARYAAQLALALAGAGDADGALVVAMRAAELAAATGSALATRELRRVHAALRERGADAHARALAEHLRALTDELG
ncbi:MAG: helix-turn-helix domain-containing protein [Pseudonocardiaceae bacterium]